MGRRVSYGCMRKDGFIQYRIVDEYDSTYEFTPRRSRIPLTLGKLITLLDGAGSDGSSLVLGPLEGNLDGGADLESLRGFVTVRSHFYPELEAHYRKVCAAFLDARLPQEDEDEA